LTAGAGKIYPRTMAVQVIAHRGASGTCPENTLPAFRRAVEVGAHMIELDVQLTADGHAVVIHDTTLRRTTTGRGAVRRRTLAEIAALDAGSWFSPRFAGARVPTLRAVLAEIAIPINVELKAAGDDGLERRVLEAVGEAGALRRVVFSSFDAESLRRLRALAPDADLGVLWSGRAYAKALALADGLGAKSVHLRKDSVVPAAVAAAHDAGLSVRVWTVNTAADLAFLTSAGIDGVFTDYPERFLEASAA
jgi:glycerophosphoryl diester phosphodiesterase